MIGSIIKYFRFSWDYVLWDIDYANIMMLTATIPVYKSTPKKKKKEPGDYEFADLGDEEPAVSDLPLDDFVKMINDQP